jgi:hypothetical protein
MRNLRCIALLLTTLACSSADHSSGFANIQGNIVAVGSHPVPNANISVSCGGTLIASALSTDSAGQFDVLLTAPGSLMAGSSASLPCVFSAIAPGYAVTSANKTISFSSGSLPVPMQLVTLQAVAIP